MTKNSKGIKIYVTHVNAHIGKTTKTSKNNEIANCHHVQLRLEY